MKQKDIKEIYQDLKLRMCVDKDIRVFFSEQLNKGEMKRVISYNKNKYYSCAPDAPSEYCSKQNLVTEVEILTSNNETYVIKEEYLGLNFEAPCDDYALTIFDKDKNIVATTEDFVKYRQEKCPYKKSNK